jgi:hypothetical protein
MKQTILLIALSVFLISCGKRDERHYAGVVVDTAGLSIAQATVWINYRQGASNFSDGGDEMRKLAITKEDGSFSSKFTLRKKEYIQALSVTSPPPKLKTISTSKYNSGSATDITFVIP